MSDTTQNKLPETIIKRNGTEVKFDKEKISAAIYNALRAKGEYKDGDINEFTKKVLQAVLKELKTRRDGKFHVEDIQDIIENTFMAKGLFDTARYFIKYRFLHKINREKADQTTLIDCNQTVDEYIGFSDWRIKANSNTSYSNAGLVNNTAGKVIANYWLDKVYSPEEGAAHRNGDYHIHDLDCLTGYCFTGDTRVVLLDGTRPTFKELVAMYGDGSPFWVVSRDKNGNIAPGKAHHPRLVKHYAELMEITISGGAKIVCTPDHEFMLRDGTYRQAKDLRSRESLMPFYSSIKGAGYLYVRDSKLGINDYMHRLIGTYGKEGTPDDYVVHHINGNKTDNRPENLSVMHDKDHRSMELKTTMRTDTWKKANNARLVEYNKSAEKRAAVSEFASSRERDANGMFYNHRVTAKRMLSRKEDVYCLTVDDFENFALEAGVFVHNCAGWSLRALLNEGFNGVRSRVNSRPPKHFREALGQMANFLGILQSEWAGAQAFSSFDTYLAPYLFRDQLPYSSVKKAIRSFVYNLNVPSRWGQCVPRTYKALRGDGKWVTKDDLKIGDEIYVVDMETGRLRKDVITHLNEFDAPEKMHKYFNEQGFNFMVTPNHRVIYKTGSNNYRIEESSKLLGRAVDIPISTWNKDTPAEFLGDEYDIYDELLELVAFIMTDGCLMKQDGKSTVVEFYKSPNRWGSDRFEELCDILEIKYTRTETESSFGGICYKYRMLGSSQVNELIALLRNDRHKMPDWFSKLSPRQCYIIIDTWVKLDGNFDGTHWKMQADTEEMQEMLAYLVIKAGKATALTSRTIGDNKTETKYTMAYKRGCRSCIVEEATPTTDKVWCPTTNTGTFVCMTDDGYVFLTGNSPFTNVTIDWTVPNDLKEQMPMRKDDHIFADVVDDNLTALAKERGADSLIDMTYKHFQPEMSIIQRAYYEVMTEGDSTGQPFTFPIPTVNITEEFNWDSPNIDILFENTAKIGSSYFQNFIGSQYKIDENGNKVRDEESYKPDAVRSMCPLTFNTKVIVRSSQDSCYKPIGEVYNSFRKGTKYECFYNGDWVKCSAVKVDPQPIYSITLANNSTYELGELHEQPIYRDGNKLTVCASDIKVGDLIPFNSSKIDAGGTNSSYLLGYALGAYLGDGSSYKGTITYSLCAEQKDDETAKNLISFWEGVGFHTNTTIENKLRSVVVTGDAFSVISKFVAGKTATDKGIVHNILNQSIEMRKGIIDGYIATDGSREKSRIYTSSERMVEDLIMLFNSVGIKAYKSFVDTRPNRLGTNANMAVSYIKDRQNYKDKYVTIDGTLYWYVTEIAVKENKKQSLYCLVTDSDEHLFTLGDGMITHNCRLQLDLRELLKRGGGLFGSAEMTGSIGVVTINMARLGYLYKGNKDGLIARMFQLMDMAKSTLEKKRVFVTEMFNRGLYPYTKRYLRNFNNHFSTIGVNGMNEMLRNFSGDTMNTSTPEGVAFCEELLELVRNKLKDFQEETGNLYNLEATPAEGTTHRFAREDAKRFPDIIQAGTPGHNYYTNSSQLPANFTDDLFMALKLQDKLQCCYTGGTVFHMYMSEAISSPDACKNIVRKVLTNFKMPYVTVTPTFSVCEKHGYIKGRHDFCPFCDEEIIAEEHAKECKCAQ